MRMLSGVLRSESSAVGARPALSTSDSMACTEGLHRGGQAVARRGSEQRCGTVGALWGLYRCVLLTVKAYAHPGSTSMVAGAPCAAFCPTQHTRVSPLLTDKRGQPKAVAQRLSTRRFMSPWGAGIAPRGRRPGVYHRGRRLSPSSRERCSSRGRASLTVKSRPPSDRPLSPSIAA